MKSSVARRPRQGFTLIELILVLTIVALVLSVGVGSSISASNDQKLSTAGRLLLGRLNVARAQAISDHTLTRVGIYADPSSPKLHGRSIQVWKYKGTSIDSQYYSTTYEWQPVGEKETFPEGIFLDSAPRETALGYLSGAGYSQIASGDPSLVRGTFVMGETLAGALSLWVPSVTGGPAATTPLAFVEFTPSGAARVYDPSGVPLDNGNPNLHFVLAQGFQEGAVGAPTYTGSQGTGGPSNWSHLIADSRTGRLRFLQP